MTDPAPTENIQSSLPFLLGKIDAKLDTIKETMDGLHTTHKHHEARLNKIETGHARITGAVGVAGSFLGWAVPQLVQWLSHLGSH